MILDSSFIIYEYVLYLHLRIYESCLEFKSFKVIVGCYLVSVHIKNM